MEKVFRKTGIDIIGDAPWGTHFCQFYQTKKDLIDILVPYFKAGLENNEFCLWITSEPLNVEDAKAALKKAVKHLDHFIKKGQIEILDYSERYTKSGKFDANNVLQDWIEKEDQALKRGYDGLRLSGNTFWLGKKDWRNFADYEEKINNVIGNYRMIAICTYSLGQCGASEVIDVVSNHQSALIRREGKWVIMESSERKRAEEALRESEERYRIAIEQSNDGVAITRGDQILYVNQKDLDIFGYEQPEEIIGKSEFITVHPDDRERVMEINRRRQKGEPVPSRYEFKGLRKDGTTVYIEVSAAKIIYRGEPASLAYLRDITERKRAEEKLNETNARLKMLQQITAAVHSTLDLEKVFGQITDGLLYSMGYISALIIMLNDERTRFEVKVLSTKKSLLRQVDEILGFSLRGFSFPADPELNTVMKAMMRGEVVVTKRGVEVGYPFTSKIVCQTLQELGGTKNYIVVPLQVGGGGKIEGGMVITSSRKEVSEEELETIRAFAFAASHAIQNANLHKQTQQAEKTLRESEDRYRDLVEHSHDLICTHDLEGRILSFNQWAVKTLGYDKEVHLKKNIRDILAPEFREEFDSYLAAIQREGAASGLMMIQTNTGEKRVWEYNNTLRTEGVPTPIVRGIAHDITERLRAEKALRKSEEKYRLLAENINDVIWAMDLDLRFTYLSPSIVRALGYTPEEYSEKKLDELFTPSSLETIMEKFTEEMKIEKRKEKDLFRSRTLEIEHIHKDGSLHWFEMKVNFLRDSEGQPVGISGLSRDINDRKRTEEQLAKLNECLVSFGSDPIENINRLVALCGEQLRATCALYNRLENGLLHSVGQWNTPPDFAPVDKPDGHICFDLIQSDSSEACVIRNLQQTTYAQTDPNVSCYNLKTYVGKTVSFGGSAVGSLCAVYQEDYIFSEDDRKLIGIIASAIGVEEKRRHAEEGLRRKSGEQDLLLDNIQTQIWYLTDKETYGAVNKARAEFFGKKKEEIENKKVYDVLGKDEAEICMSGYAEVFEKRKQIHTEEWITNTKGEKHLLSITKCPKLDENGSVEYVVCSAEDITARKHAEEALRVSLEKYRVLFESFPLGITISDKSGKIIEGNRQSEQLLGISREEHAQRRINSNEWQIIRRDGTPMPADEFASTRALRENRLIENVEMGIVKDKGEITWISVTAAPIPLEGFGVAIAYGDITERKQAEEALRKSEEKYRDIFENIAGGIYRTTPEGRYVIINPAFAAICGYASPEEMMEKVTDIQKQIYANPEDRLRFQKRVDAEGQVKGFEVQFKTPTRGLVWVSIHSKALRDEQGNIRYYDGTIEDITEHKRVEEELREKELFNFALFEYNPIQTVVVDLEGKVTGFNLAKKRSGDRLPNIGDVMYKDYAGIHETDMYGELMKCIRSGEKKEFPEEKYGDKVLSITISPFPKGAVIISQDITARKRAEEALRQAGEKYRSIFENVIEGIFQTTPEGSFLTVNPVLARMYGYSSPEEMIETITDIGRQVYVNPDERLEFLRILQEKGTITGLEVQLKRKDGSAFWASINARAVYDENGNILYHEGTSENITERKRAEEALQVSLEKYRVLFESFPLGITISDKSGKIIEGNRQSEQLLGITREAHAQRRIDSKEWQIIRKDGTPMPADGYASTRALRENRLIENVEMGIVKDKGEITWISVTAAPIPLEGYGVAIAYSDITERKQAEEALRRKSEEQDLLLNNIQTQIWYLTDKETYGAVNKARAEFFGKKNEEMENKKLSDVLGKDEAEICMSGYAEVFEKRKQIHTEEWITNVKGEKRLLSIIKSPKLDENGDVEYVVCSAEDITERKRVEEALRENEVRYRELFENTNSGVAVYQVTGNGQDFIFKDFNRAGEKIDHDQRERLIGKSIFEVRPGVEQFGLIEVLRQVWQTGEPGYHPVTLYQDDQLSGWYENFVYKLPSGEIMVVFENVTERKQAEEALRQSEARFRSVFNNAFVGMAIVNPEGHVVEANEAFFRFLEYSREELIGRHFTECTHQEDLSIDSDLYTALLDDERLSYSIDKRYMRKGKVVWGRLSVSLIKDEAGQLENTVVVREDITERKRAEEALRGSEEKYRLLVENANEAIFVVQEERLKFVNRKVSEIMGHTQEEITSRPFSDLIHPEDREMVLDNYLRRLRGETVPSIYAFRVIDKDGNARWVELGAVKIDWEGKPATLNLATDITERKRAEGEMGLLQEQFRHSQKMEAVGRLAGGVAHDFNNLLTVIRGYSELCLGKLGKEDPLWRKVEGIRRASEQGARLTSQLLAFSRHQVMKMKVINLNRFFKDLDRMLRRVIGEDIELVTILAEDLGGVKADLGQTEQVIMNLAVNARDAMPEGGKLTIEAKNVELDGVFFESHAGGEPGRYVMFSVSDTGFGMTPEVKEHLFEPFFTTKGEGKGTGLGLSTVYGIVKQSGGEITVESEVGKGSAFLIYLPLVEGVMEDQKEEEQGAWGGKETVLVVEDEENVRRLAAEVLEGQGYEVLEASGGEEALQIMEGYGGRVDLILTDVVMPGMSGRELGKRSVERWGMVKVLYMSGFFDEERVPLNVLEEGMNYVQKPFTIDALTRKVREVLDK